MRTLGPLPVFAAAALTILPATASFAAWPNDPGLNLPVCTATGSQFSPVAAPDGQGGAFIAWTDGRSGGFDIYIQHVTRAGAVDPTWPVNGKVVCNAAGDQTVPQMISDNAGGVILTWQDHRGASSDIYALRLGPTGVPAAGWTANGTAIQVASGEQTSPMICTDGGNGAYIEYEYTYGVNDDDPYLIHILGDATVPIGWGGSGVDIDPALTFEQRGAIAPDGSGNVLLAYETNAAGTFDIRVAKYGPGGVRAWIATPTSAAGDQRYPYVASDGTGGAYVAWTDYSSGSANVQLNRIASTGGFAGDWVAGGYTYAGTGSDESVFSLIPDGAEGCYVGWLVGSFGGFGVQLSRVLPNSNIVSAWYPYVSLSEGTGTFATMVQDGAGGVVVGTNAYSNGFGSNNLNAQRFNASGSRGLGWPGGGDLRICNQSGGRDAPTIAPDGNNGFIFAWDDSRPDNAAFDIYAQRVHRFGQLGNPEPAIAGIKDVKNDQGGRVRLEWNPSYLDVDPTFGISDYRIWRQVPAASAQQAIAQGRGVLDDDPGLAAARATPINARGPAPASASQRATRYAEIAKAEASFLRNRTLYRADPAAAQGFYWEEIASIEAAQQPQYSYVAPTTGDSIGASNPFTVFQVDARAYYAGPFYTSAADSGYSVDNLPPVAPAPFTATFSPPNGTFASWGANSEPDLAGYRLYRGGGLGFTPSPANRIYDGTVPSYHDATNTAFIYKVCAYDIHGNEGGCTSAQPPGTADAESNLPRELTLAPATPNPAREGVMMRLGLPRDARVTLAIYDAQGRRVKTVLEGVQMAGWIEARWDGRDESGARTASGLYFARLEAGARRLTQRLVRLE